MGIFLAIVLFVGGMVVGGIIIYSWEEAKIVELIMQCNNIRNKLDEMLTQEEKVIESMWPKQNPHISMSHNLADYLKAKYLNDELEPDCEDESDNLYV